MPALVMGAVAGVICYFACGAVKSAFGYDDSLDAFGIHGIGGTVGAVLTGVFATTAVNPGGGNGIWYDPAGGMSLLIGQVVGVVVTFVFAIVATLILIKLLDVTIGIRVSQDTEIRGLDVSEHGEEGYILLS